MRKLTKALPPQLQALKALTSPQGRRRTLMMVALGAAVILVAAMYVQLMLASILGTAAPQAFGDDTGDGSNQEFELCLEESDSEVTEGPHATPTPEMTAGQEGADSEGDDVPETLREDCIPPVQTGELGWPVTNPYVTSNYGMRLHPIAGVWRMHSGTDFRAPCGAPIFAAESGRVTFASRAGGYGLQVIVEHPSASQKLQTSYSHLSRHAGMQGATVVRGQIVGYSGNTGSSTACHLHFEVKVNGKTVNPMTWLR